MAHPRAKLTEDAVKAIITAAAEGTRSGLIAARFGIGKNAVLDILRGRTWRDIDRPELPQRATGRYERPKLHDGLCKIHGCGKPVDARGWCSAHWSRWRMHGDPLAGRTPPGKPWQFLERAVSSSDLECIQWPYARTLKGYACVTHGGKQHMAYRIVCELAHGEPPSPDYEAAHSCGKGHLGCINPNHLRWATKKENAQDRQAHGTEVRGERHPAAKLTEEAVRQIRAAQGSETQASLAARFGVSCETVRDIHRRRIMEMARRLTRRRHPLPRWG